MLSINVFNYLRIKVKLFLRLHNVKYQAFELIFAHKVSHLITTISKFYSPINNFMDNILSIFPNYKNILETFYKIMQLRNIFND